MPSSAVEHGDRLRADALQAQHVEEPGGELSGEFAMECRAARLDQFGHAGRDVLADARKRAEVGGGETCDALATVAHHLRRVDDMDMKAISLRMDPGEAAARAVAAGCDVVLQCGGDLDRVAAALEGLVYAIEDDSFPVTRLDDALQRNAALKGRFLSDEARRHAPAPPTLREVIGSAEHALVAEQMRQFA